MVEADLERYLSQEARRTGHLVLKLRLMGETGWPDRLVVLPGRRVLWIELKTPSGKLSKRQVYVHDKLLNLGHRVLVLRSKEEIRNALATA